MSSTKATHTSEDLQIHMCTPNEVLCHGLELFAPMGLRIDGLFNDEDIASHIFCVDWFKRAFGPDHVAAASVWNDLLRKSLVNVKKDKASIITFLVALFFIKSFKSSHWNDKALIKKSKSTRRIVRFYIPRIAALKPCEDHMIENLLDFISVRPPRFVLHICDAMIVRMAKSYCSLSTRPFCSENKRMEHFRAVLALCQYQVESRNPAAAA